MPHRENGFTQRHSRSARNRKIRARAAAPGRGKPSAKTFASQRSKGYRTKGVASRRTHRGSK